MRLQIFQVDAFSSVPLAGNPAAVCPLDAWLPDETLLAIAAENNLAETAYFVPMPGQEDHYHLRWFTPEVEVELCGHATLATSWVIFNELGVTAPMLVFKTLGGELRVTREDNTLSMDFPATYPTPCVPPPALLSSLGIEKAEVWAARDFIVVVDDAAQIAALSPDFGALKECTTFGVSVTAPGTETDFVSRWFGPKVGVDEDITTGAAHSWLAPYWAGRLEKKSLTAEQGGKRKGRLTCEVKGPRVILSGRAATYLIGNIDI